MKTFANCTTSPRDADGISWSTPVHGRLGRVGRAVKVAVPLVLVALIGSFTVGTFHGIWWSGRRQPEFHDMLAIHPGDYTCLVDPHDPAVELAARELLTPERAYAFVRDEIGFVPAMPVSSPAEILEARQASCLGKAVLLCSLYRAMGIPPEQVHVVTGEVVTPAFTSDHAWVELEEGSRRLQLDTTDLIRPFEYDAFPGNSYTRAFVRKEWVCFNDRGLAVVSQLNRMSGSAEGEPAP